MEDGRKKTAPWEKLGVQILINLLMLLVFWGGMLRKSYNADTVYHMLSGDADVLCNIEAGRYVIALGDFLLLKLGVRTTTDLSVTMLVTFILFAVAMEVNKRIFKRWQPEGGCLRLCYICGIHLVFLNVLFAELLMFSEYCVYYAIGYLLAALGVIRFTRRKYLSMFLLFALAASTYQYTMIYAAILIAFYVCLDHQGEFSLKASMEELVGIGACMGVGGLNLLSVKMLEKLEIIKSFGKSAGVGDVGEKARMALAHLARFLKDSDGIFPNLWLPLLFSLALAAFIIYHCAIEKKAGKLPFIFLVWLGSILLLYVIPVMQTEFSFPPRMSFCFYLVQGMTAIVACTVCREKMQKLLLACCGGYLTAHLLFSGFVVTNHFISNTLDEVYVTMMYQEILKYEKETGITVDKLAIAKDAYAPDHYLEVGYTSGQINERTLGTVTNSIVWKVTGRRFENLEIEEEIYDQHFRGKDWACFDLSQQFFIEDDTAYWCIF